MIDRNALQIHLGEDFDKLDSVVKNAHIGIIELEGNVEVLRGNFIARVVCNILNMPHSGKSVFNTVKAFHYPDRMLWERTFDGLAFNSCFILVDDYLVENMGPLKLYLKGVVEDGALMYNLVFAKLFGVRIPRVLAPKLYASESDCCGGYKFIVRVSLPFFGLIIQYSGVISLKEKFL